MERDVFQVIFIQICTYNPILFKIDIDKTHYRRKKENPKNKLQNPHI